LFISCYFTWEVKNMLDDSNRNLPELNAQSVDATNSLTSGSEGQVRPHKDHILLNQKRKGKKENH